MAKEHSAKWHNDNDAIEHPDDHFAHGLHIDVVNNLTTIGISRCECGFSLTAVSTNQANVTRMIRNKYRAHIKSVESLRQKLSDASL